MQMKRLSNSQIKSTVIRIKGEIRGPQPTRENHANPLRSHNDPNDERLLFINILGTGRIWQADYESHNQVHKFVSQTHGDHREV